MRLAPPTTDIDWADVPDLPRNHLATIVGGLADLDKGTVHSILDLAEGNVLAAVQVASALGRGTDVPVPTCVDDAVTAVWMTASEAARRLLWTCALIGRETDMDLLFRVLARSGVLKGMDVDSAMIDARRSGLVTRTSTALRFRHELERRWVLTGAPPSLARRLHPIIAQALIAEGVRGAGAAARMAEIARHWSAGGRYAESARAGLDAGMADCALSAFPEALDHVEHAMADLDKVNTLPGHAPSQLPRAVIPTAAAARWAGQAARGATVLRAMVPHLDGPSWVLAWERIGWLEREAGNRDAANNAYTRALSRSTTADARTRALAGRAAFEMTAFNLDAAAELCAEGLALCADEVSAQRANLLCTRGVVRALQGDAEMGLADLSQSRTIADQAGSEEDFWRYVGNTTYVLENNGREDDAVDLALEAMRRAARTGIIGATTVLPVVGNAACALVALGRWDEALTLIESIPEPSDDTGAASAVVVIAEAEIRICRGEQDRARHLLAIALRLAQRWPTDALLGEVHRLRAELHYWENDLANGLVESARGLAAVGTEVVAAGSVATALQLYQCRARILADVAGPGMPVLGADVADTSAALAVLWAGVTAPAADEIAAAATARAELARGAHAYDCVEVWTAAAAAWANANDPYQEAYCRYRLAEMLAASDRRRAARELKAAKVLPRTWVPPRCSRRSLRWALAPDCPRPTPEQSELDMSAPSWG